MWYVGGYFIKNLTKKINSKIGSIPNYTPDLLLILECFKETDDSVEDDETNDELYTLQINLEKETKRMLEELDEFTTGQKIDRNKVIAHLKEKRP